jgi:hypothetical protein
LDGGSRLVRHVSLDLPGVSNNWVGRRRFFLSDNGLCHASLCYRGWSFSSFRRLGE